jgi:hypothetical protein
VEQARVDLGARVQEVRQALVDYFDLGAFVAPEFLVVGAVQAQGEASSTASRASWCQRDGRRRALGSVVNGKRRGAVGGRRLTAL